jgi:pseudouridine synthase
VGRLDYNTEGMLIMTNDGDFAHLVTHPKHELPKTYLAKLKGVLDEGQIASIETGLYLDDGKTAPAKLRKIRKEEANSWVEITITEGRKRQVRRMFDRVGRSVIKLKRIRTGNLVLGDLPEGTFRYLTPVEVKGLMDLSQKTEVKPLKPLSMVKPAVVRKEGPAAGGSGAESRNPRPEYRVQGTAGRGRDDRRPMKYKTRTRPSGAVVMQDTSDGRRKNQMIKPRTANEPERVSGRSTRPSAVHKREDNDRSAAKGAVVRKTASTATAVGNREARRIPAQRSWATTKISQSRSRGSAYETRDEGRRPSSGPRTDSAFKGRTRPGGAAAMGKPEVRRKPDQRPWPSTRKSAPASRGPGVVPGYGARSVSSARPATRSAMSRPTTTARVSRPAPGAVSGRPETRRKPAPRSWPDSGRSDSRSKGAWHGSRETGQRPASGPRPNRSTHTGKGPTRGNRPAGSRGPGKRGPRR